MGSQAITVAVNMSKGIAVHAKGNPAQIVAYGATAGVVFISVAVGYGIFEGARYLNEQRKRLRSNPT